MIPTLAVMGWLNQFSETHLSKELLADIEKASAAATENSVRYTLMHHLETIVPLLVNPLEQAELLANLGGLWYPQAHTGDNSSVELWLAAHALYQSLADLHRQTIIEWLLYIAYHNQGDKNSAENWVNEARRNLWRLAQYAKDHKMNTPADWYRNQVYQITSQQIEVPHYVYDFLFAFGESYLGDTARVVKHQIEQFLDEGDLLEGKNKAYQLQKITSRSLNTLETAEALAFIGLVFVEKFPADKEMVDQAVGCWKESLTLYIPGSHAHTLVAWMLALEYYNLRDMEIRSIEMMEACIRNTKALAQNANYRNNPIQETWYEILAAAMRLAMTRILSISPIIRR